MECMCSICLDSLFSVNTDVSVTQCGHMYHKTCLENWMNTSPTCPNCKAGITYRVQRIYPNVFADLVYNGTSDDTETFLGEIYDCEKQKRTAMLKLIKRLDKIDKENKDLTQTNKRHLRNLETCKVFIKCFQKERKEWKEKSRNLRAENSVLIAELKTLNTDLELNIVLEESHLKHGKQIKNFSVDNSSYNIEEMLSKGLLSYFCFYFLIVL